MVVACVVITAAAAYGFSVSHTSVYTATASLLFRNSTLDQQVSGTNFFAPTTDPARDASTDLRLVSLGTVSGLTATALHNGMTGADVQSRISISSQGQSNVVDISATDRDPSLAAKLANAYAQEYITFSASSDRMKIREAQRLVQNQFSSLSPALQASSQGQTLSNRAEQLSILASVQTGNATLVQAAGVPSSPSSPQPRRDAMIGLLLGLILGLSAALLLDRLDRRLHNVDEVAEAYALPVLGVIPRDPGLAAPLHQWESRNADSIEAFHLLRSRLTYFNVDRDLQTIMVTSFAPNEGKTTVAWNLAVASARAGQHRVLVIEADLRRPQLALLLELEGSLGLSEAISQRFAAEHAIQTVDDTLHTNGARAAHTVDVLLAGAIPPNPGELLESAEMKRIMTHLKVMYDQIIIDTAPMAAVSDAIPLVGLADGVVVVSRMEKASRDSAKQLRIQLRQLNAPVLGVIANDVKAAPTAGYYGYAATGEQPSDRPRFERPTKTKRPVRGR